MNINKTFHPKFAQQRGIALIVVLSVLVLMSALLVAFMGRVSTERTAARAAAQGFEARQAAESAVNLVISQIRDATSATKDGVGWASQPGAIRTFGSSGGAGSDLMVYKLYSALKMQEDASAYAPGTPAESGIDPSDPLKEEKMFVDLNKPMLTPDPSPTSTKGEVLAHYPIVDPAAALDIKGKVVVPGKGIVEGFSCNLDAFDKVAKDKDGNFIRLLPMRARWLYQLKDGTLVAPDTSNEIAGATKDNPPVARVAFWTDDESCKININTAGENTFWDTPSVSSIQESGDVAQSGDGTVIVGPTFGSPASASVAVAASQPAALEYQRFPGHPATTNLSPALRWLFVDGATVPPVGDLVFKEALYRLMPRLNGGYGSSMAGSRATETDLHTDTDVRPLERDRLYSTLDELWLRPDRTPISSPGLYTVFRSTTLAAEADKQFAHSSLTPAALERLRFFLTANSRAPELNLFGMPRICIWPVHELDDPNPATSKRSGYDDLIAFCSTVAGKPYYFMRRDPWSTTYDYVNAGLGTNVGRNKKLIEGYLKRLANTAVPGNGGKFTAKYGASAPDSAGYTDMDQILLSIFDYIRSTNLVDTGRKDTTGAAGFPLAYTPSYSPNSPPDYSGNTKPNLGSGQVTPTVIYTTVGGKSVPAVKGFGRFTTMSEVYLMFYYDDALINPLTPLHPNDTPPPPGVAGTNYIPMRCLMMPEMFTVSPGYPALSEGYAYKAEEINSQGQGTPFTITSMFDTSGGKTNLAIAGDPSNSTLNINHVEVDTYRVGYGRFFMPTRGMNNQFFYDQRAPGAGGAAQAKTLSKKLPAAGAAPLEHYRQYPFYSKIIYLERGKIGGAGADVLPTEFKMNGGSFTFELYPLGATKTVAPLANTSQPIQRISVTFPPVTLPVPKKGDTIATRIARCLDRGNNQDWHMITANDTIRTLEACGTVRGDLRLVAGRGVVSEGAFAPSGAAGQYATKTLARLHNYRSSWGRIHTDVRSNGWYGLLTNAAVPRTDKTPKVAKTAQGSMAPDGSVTGDYDRGISKHTDGPFINKPDEGNTRFKMSDNYPGGGHIPYYRGGGGYEEVGQTYFSPNRLIASAVMFGSLPTGIYAGRPWETLLFSPPTTVAHKGAKDPADHFMLDWFHMPVVEPYAISEPLSTSGKINLNCRMAPYGYINSKGRKYIERDTGLHAILKGMKQLIVKTGTLNEAHTEQPKTISTQFRFDVDRYATIEKVINPRLDTKGYFRSATEICEIDLLNPLFAGPATPTARKAFWEANNNTGDNHRERPYAHIYPRLTTKSNIYTVHFWSQAISKSPNAKAEDFNKFDEDKGDRVTGEYRGSTTIERYIDPNDKQLIDGKYDAANSGTTTVNSSTESLEKYYRFRILNHRRFMAR